MRTWHAALAVGVIALAAEVRSDDGILAAISRENELSIFRERLTGASWLSFLQDEGKITAFVPTNTAIEKFGKHNFNRLSDEDSRRLWLRNFFTTVAIYANDLPKQQASFMKGGPKLFFSPYKEDPTRFYVNEALVIRKSQGSDNVLVYMIDAVPNFSTFNNTPPSADEVLQSTSKIAELRAIQISGFRGRVNRLGLRELFDSTTPSTFFIPIGSQDMPALTSELIQAHVIPGEVLFTPQFGNGVYVTAASGSGDATSSSSSSSTRIEVTLVNETVSDLSAVDSDQTPHHHHHHHHEHGSPRAYDSSGRAILNYALLVKSTVKGPSSRGSVLSRVHLANVPVSNGVIHFVESPLGLVTKTIYDYLQDPRENKNRFNMFFDILKQSAEFVTEIKNTAQMRTLFVPTNQAVSVLPNDVWTQYTSNATELYKLLRYHLVPTRVLTEDSLARAGGAVTANSAAGVPLVLRRVSCQTGCHPDSHHGGQSELVVECAGVNGSVVSADIAAVNGVIHLIDRVLGAPSHSLGWKLQNEESLTTTQVVATKGLWNKLLDQPTNRFTLLAPDNGAWQWVSEVYPSVYKRLVQLPGEAHTQAAHVMNRHLIDGELTRDDLLKTTELHTRTGDTIYVSRNGDQIVLSWNSAYCQVVRSDLQATNGVIHIINCVFLMPRDLIASSVPATTSPQLLLAAAVPLLLAMVFSARQHV